MNELINFIFKQATLEWSAFAGCFSEAQWRSVQAVWCPNGSWDGCEWLHNSVMLNKYVCGEFPFNLAIPKALEAHNLA